jgi:AraC-like DNA-binding protein
LVSERRQAKVLVDSKAISPTFVDVDWICRHKWSAGDREIDRPARIPSLWIVLSGAIRITIGDHSWQVKGGQVCWSVSGHRDITVLEDAEWLSIGLRITGLPRVSGVLAKIDPVFWVPPEDELELMRGWMMQAFSIASSRTPKFHMHGLSERYTRECLSKLDVGSSLVINGLGSALLGTAIPRISRHLPLLPEWLEETIKQIEESPCMPVTEWAKNAGYSVSQFRHLFQTHLDISPRRYKQECMFRRACYLLETTDLPLSSISEELSFDSMASFCRFFKQLSGNTPTEFRESAYPSC